MDNKQKLIQWNEILLETGYRLLCKSSFKDMAQALYLNDATHDQIYISWNDELSIAEFDMSIADICREYNSEYLSVYNRHCPFP